MQPANNALLDRVYDALNGHHPAAVAALATRDVEVEDVPWGRTASGHQAVDDHYRRFFSAFPDARYSSRRRIEQGNTIVDEWVIDATNTGEIHLGKLVLQPTNNHFQLHGVSVFEIDGGLVRRQRLYYDALTFARQLGLTQLLQARSAGQ